MDTRTTLRGINSWIILAFSEVFFYLFFINSTAVLDIKSWASIFNHDLMNRILCILFGFFSQVVRQEDYSLDCESIARGLELGPKSGHRGGNSMSVWRRLSNFSARSRFKHPNITATWNPGHLPGGGAPALNHSAAPPVRVSLSNILNPVTLHPYQRSEGERLHWDLSMELRNVKNTHTSQRWLD